MKAKNTARFDTDALRRRVGDKTFARGEAYHRGGRVVLLSLDPKRILAQVEGSEDYQVELHGQGKTLGGECTCPAFEDAGTCKHMVAVALTANVAGDDGEAAGVGALSRIQGYLMKKDAAALAEMIVKLAARDPALFRELDLAAVAAVPGDSKEIEAHLRKAIDTATRIREFVGYRAARGWAAGVGTALDAVAALLQQGQAGIVLKLAEHAIGRIEKAIGGVDDSDGHCGALLTQARDIHLAAALAAKPESVAFARALFAREMEDGYDIFFHAADTYKKVLGKAGLGEYRRLATAAWEKLPSRSGKTRIREENEGDYDTLMRILDSFAERDGDIDARIALREKKLTSPWDFLKLAEFCLQHGRKAEALRWAEEGLWVFEDGEPDERLVLFTTTLLQKAGRKDDVHALLQRAFEKAPGRGLYKQLVKLGGSAARESALKILEAQAGTGQRGPIGAISLLTQILIEEKAYGAAWTAVHKYGVGGYNEDDLARRSEKTHPREALAVYAKRVEAFANAGSNEAYAEAAKLIKRMASLQSAAEQATYIAGLKQRFERRRNFMKLIG